jgi:predicted DNA-binding transcriptional regulator AlpA
MIGSACILSKRQCALLIGVAERTIDRWMASGDFPLPVHNGARYPKWSYSAVESFLRARRAQEAAHAG